MVHSSVLSDMDGHQESQFEWLSAKLLSGSKVKECCQVQHLVDNFIVGTFANQFPIGFFCKYFFLIRLSIGFYSPNLI